MMSYLKYTSMDPDLYQYMLDIHHPLSSSLRTIYLENQQHPQIHMQISIDQAIFLQFLVKNKSIKHILELGTFLGFSTAAMAEALPEHGKIISCDIDTYTTQIAKTHWEVHALEKKIELKINPAEKTMQEFLQQKIYFDFIFIDADKKNYILYYELGKKLLSPQGVMAIDNVFFHKEVLIDTPSATGSAIQKFNLHVKADQSVEISILPIADGLMLIQNK